jgi:hypothetical protein
VHDARRLRVAVAGAAPHLAHLGDTPGAQRDLVELGVASRDAAFVQRLAALFDAIWIGEQCQDCGYRERCPDPIDGA